MFCYTQSMKYKAVLFDMDGVILDSEPIHLAAFRATLANKGHILSDEDYKQHFAGKTDEAGFKQYFNFMNEEVDLSFVMNQKAKRFLELAADQLIPYPNIVSLIKELSKHVPLVLVTGSLRVEAEIALNACNVIDCFKGIIAAEDVKHGKPDPEGYLQAVNLLGLKTSDCVVVEDSPSGVKAANNAGIDCIAITNTHTSDELKVATKVVGSLSIDLF